MAYDHGKAGFSVSILEEVNRYKIYSVFVLPGTEFTVSSESDIQLSGLTEYTSQLQVKKWNVSAPLIPGAYALTISGPKNEEMHLNILVLTPMKEKKGEYLNGYRIGYYPIATTETNPIYSRPKGLFEVTEENQDMLLTPHFTMQQFLCKQSSGFPKYIIVRERLLLKLEYLLEKVNNKGYSIETFGFISGYRTPYYNKSINNVSKSRHIYGGAADIFIDQDKDGEMDDMNEDGLIDEKDVRIFYSLVEEEFNNPDYKRFRGGLGFYKRNTVHHGFIHVDVRGWKARW